MGQIKIKKYENQWHLSFCKKIFVWGNVVFVFAVVAAFCFGYIGSDVPIRVEYFGGNRIFRGGSGEYLYYDSRWGDFSWIETIEKIIGLMNLCHWGQRLARILKQV